MARTKISEFSATPANNTDIDSINIAEGCAPSGINDAIRELMAQLKDFQTGAVGDSFNGPVGTTTAAAGAFTTLAASGAVTLSGGTANGVTYLNGSKVLTSGSALTFDGTNLGVGIGGAGIAPIDVSSNGSAVGIILRGRSADSIGTLEFKSNDGATVRAQLQSRGDELRFLSAGNVPITSYINGSEQMRLTSTGLGIGTSSPAARLDLNASGSNAQMAVQNWPMMRVVGTTIDIGGYNASQWTQTRLYTNGNIAATIDSSGNLGLGVTNPSTYGKLTVNGTPYFYNASNEQIRLGSNDGASYYALGRDNVTTGNFIIKRGGTTIATIDTSGNLGLGVTPSAWSLGKAVEVGFLGNGVFSPSQGVTNIVNNTYYSSSAYRYATTAAAAYYSVNSGLHQWYTAPSGTAGAAISFTQAMTLDASGNVQVGTTTGSSRMTLAVPSAASTARTVLNLTDETQAGVSFILHTDLVRIATGGSDALAFETNNAERARIDSSGNLLVGTTTNTLGGGSRVIAQTSNAFYTYTSNQTGTGTKYHFQFADTGVACGTITSSGSTTAYNTSSDYRLKNTIAPMTGALAKVALLKPVTYKWNSDGSDGEGFIAHELAEICPAAVTGEKDAVDAEGNPRHQGIDVSFLVGTLTAAIQELKAIVDAQGAEIAALKAAA